MDDTAPRSEHAVTDDLPTDDTPVEPAAHNRARLRVPKRLLLVGPPASFAGSFLTSLLGADGRAGAFAFLLLLALTFGATGVLVTGQLFLDDRRGAPTSAGRAVLSVALFVVTFVCMVAVGGLVVEPA